MTPGSKPSYRIQFNPGFGFAQAEKILNYLADLGIGAVYASPIFKPRPGSMHGYDVCDHQALNPELGTDRDFARLILKVKSRGLAWIQDIVPNHMAVDGGNRLLVDLLENGPNSRYFRFFDIDWDYPYEGIRGRMLVPVLGGFYGRTLERGEIALGLDQEGFFISYYDIRMPLRLETYARVLTLDLEEMQQKLGRDHPDLVKLQGILYSIKALGTLEQNRERYDQIYFIKRLLFELYSGSGAVKKFIDRNVARFNGQDGQGPARYNLLESLLNEQYFRLSFWKVASEEINYRRFFSINDLICLRVEDPAVFEHVHALILDKVKDGSFTGLRVDHIDGLYDPGAYLRKLRERCGDIYIVVEKILAENEPLPSFWPVQGTTGYDFMNLVCGLFVKTSEEQAFNRVYTRFTGQKTSVGDIIADKKRLIIRRHMTGDADNLARLAKAAAGKNRHGFDLTLNSLRQAITEVLVHFPVYRSYLSPDIFRPEDLTYIEQAVDAAAAENPDLRLELDFLRRFLLLRFDETMSAQDRQEWMHFVMRFQQFTGPLMAKGMEDTVLYIVNRLLCLNEVGGQPDVFGMPGDKVHEVARARFRAWPNSMNATATHDAKRGEDARMRLAALSEIPDAWGRALRKFRQINARKKKKVHGRPAPSLNDEYFLYQVLLASWPFDDDLGDYPERLGQYLLKAVREAKVQTGWITPDEDYEQAYLEFAEKLVTGQRRNAFLKEFLPLKKRIAHLGVINSLSLVLLKITMPGVPDFYQGTELWDLSFVDPDNRRPVDFSLRARHLARLKKDFAADPTTLIRELLADPRDGRIKMFTIMRALAARAARPNLFEQGEYKEIGFEGPLAGHLFGFARSNDSGTAVIVAPRFLSGLIRAGQYPLGDFWEDTRIVLPENVSATPTEALTGRDVPVKDGGVRAKDALRDFPAALIVSEQPAV